MRGRRPTPKPKLKLAGAYRQDRHGNTPDPPATVAKCPAWLKGSARKQWPRIAPMLADMRMDSSHFTIAPALLCDALADWIEYSELAADAAPVGKTKNGNVMQHPIVPEEQGVGKGPKSVSRIRDVAGRASRNRRSGCIASGRARRSIEMSETVLTFNFQSQTVVALEVEDLPAALDHLSQMVRMARGLDRARFPSVLPQLRDSLLLNLARYFTAGRFSDAAQDAFTQLAVRAARSTSTRDALMIAGFGITDALDAAIADPERWPDFDSKFEEMKQLLTEGL